MNWRGRPAMTSAGRIASIPVCAPSRSLAASMGCTRQSGRGTPRGISFFFSGGKKQKNPKSTFARFDRGTCRCAGFKQSRLLDRLRSGKSVFHNENGRPRRSGLGDQMLRFENDENAHGSHRSARNLKPDHGSIDQGKSREIVAEKTLSNDRRRKSSWPGSRFTADSLTTPTQGWKRTLVQIPLSGLPAKLHGDQNPFWCVRGGHSRKPHVPFLAPPTSTSRCYRRRI